MWTLLKDLLDVHFDEILLTFILLVVITIAVWHPSYEKWIELVLGALLLALKSKTTGRNGNGGSPPSPPTSPPSFPPPATK